MKIDKKIEICKRTRGYAQEALFKVIQKILDNNIELSEAEIRDAWLLELRKNDSVFKDGWYSPPPHGIGVLIGTDKDEGNNRLNYKSLRPEEMWPRNDIRLNTENGIIYAYASPVDKETGIIGDFGVTLYFGKDKEIIDHLKLTYEINQKIFDYVEPGMTFSEIAGYAKVLIDSHGLNNEIVATTSPSLADDVGHTIPFSFEDASEAEAAILKNGGQEEINRIISEKRIYVRASEEINVKKGMAFTIEPRPKIANNPNIPMVSFHTICAIYENGGKELFTNFDELFESAGMHYMIN